MKNKIIYIAFITLFSFQIQAQDKKEAIKELFKVMEVEKMTSDMMDNMIPMLKQQAEQSFKNEKDRTKFDNYMQFALEEVKVMSVKLATEEMPLVYEKHFTIEDIEYLTKFYKSATGQKLLDKTPEITKETVKIMMSKYMPELQKKIKSKLKELKKTDS